MGVPFSQGNKGCCMLSKMPVTTHVRVLMLICGLFALDPAQLGAADNGKEGFTRAEALLKGKKYSKAMVQYEKILTRDPSFVAAYPGLIQCYAALGDVDVTERGLLVPPLRRHHRHTLL